MIRKKKILIITHGFYPRQSPRAFRATELAKEFFRQGHEVTVMAPERENIQDLLTIYPINYVSLGHFKWRVFNFKGLGFFGRGYNKVVNRILPLLFAYPMIEFIPKIKKAFQKDNNTYDLLISVAVPYSIHWAVAAIWENKLKNRIGIWAADCGDPYSLQQNDTFRPPFYFHWIEKWFMKKPHFITVPTHKSNEGYFTEFHHKLKVIPQGFRFEDINLKTKINDGVVRFGYGGAFIPGRRDPSELLTFLSSLDQNKKFEFHIYTQHQHLVAQYAKKDSRIILHQPNSRTALLEQFSAFDFVVNFSNVGLAQTPSKLIDYAIIDKPILTVQTGNLNIEQVDDFLNGKYETSFSVADPDQYRIENVVQKFLNLTV